MNILFKIIVTLLFPIFAIGAGQANKSSAGITIGFISGANPESFDDQGTLLAKALQAKLNLPVNIYISKIYEGLAKSMADGSIDFAFFSPSMLVQVEQQIPLKVLLKKVWKEPFYYSAIIVPKKSNIKKISDLKGKRFAFVDKKSASGYLYPLVALKKNGLSESAFKEVTYSGNHEKSVQLLQDGIVDAAAVFSDDEKGLASAWSLFGGKSKTNYRILWLSEPIPNDAFCVRQKFYDESPKLVHEIMFALVDLVDGKENKGQFSDLIGSKGLMPATSRQYDVVREMQKTLN